MWCDFFDKSNERRLFRNTTSAKSTKSNEVYGKAYCGLYDVTVSVIVVLSLGTIVTVAI